VSALSAIEAPVTAMISEIKSSAFNGAKGTTGGDESRLTALETQRQALIEAPEALHQGFQRDVPQTIQTLISEALSSENRCFDSSRAQLRHRTRRQGLHHMVPACPFSGWTINVPADSYPPSAGGAAMTDSSG